MLSAGIKARNTKFKKLGKAEKRVALAKDAIRQIKANILFPKGGNYTRIIRSGLWSEEFMQSSFQDRLVNKEIECECCAKGALICSFVGFENEASVIDIGSINEEQIRDKLKGVFSPRQLHMIEFAFEGREIMYFVYSSEIGRRLGSYFDHYDDPSERLIAILENIIKNKGTFKP